MEEYIARYGYIAIVIGTFFEGETTVLLGGIFSKLHYIGDIYLLNRPILGKISAKQTGHMENIALVKELKKISAR